MKNYFKELNRGRRSLKDKVREGPPKTAIVSENIDHHVTYREIEAPLGISATSIHSILHKDLTLKKICSRWISHNWTIAQKKCRVDLCKEMLQKYNASKDAHKITVEETWICAYEPETKQ